MALNLKHIEDRLNKATYSLTHHVSIWIPKKLCTTKFALLPTRLFSIEDGKNYGVAFLQKVTIIEQETMFGGWRTLAVLKKDDALLYLMER